MFYSKWTFSLTSLVLILALALVAPSAMAEFSVDLSVVTSATDFANPDVSDEGGVQVQQDVSATTAFIRINTGGVVQQTDTAATDQAAARGATTLELLDFEVIAYNHFGGTVTPPALTDMDPIAADDGKTFTMQLAVPAAPTGDLGATDIVIPSLKVYIAFASPSTQAR